MPRSTHKLTVKCINRNGEETTYTIEKAKPSTAYTIATLVVSTILAGGSVVLFYTANKENLYKLVAGIVMNLLPGIYFGKDSCDTVRDLSQPSKEYMAVRVAKVAGGFVLGTMATIPPVIAEYIESQLILLAIFQACGFPPNFAGMYGALNDFSKLFSSWTRKKEPLVPLAKDEVKLMQQARRTLLINLLSAAPEIRSADKHFLEIQAQKQLNLEAHNLKMPVFIPNNSSLATKLYFALKAFEEGKDITTANKFLYYARNPLTYLSGTVFSGLLLVGGLGLLASTRTLFDANDGPIEFLRFPAPWDWVSSNFLMLPAVYFSFAGGFGVAKMLVDSGFTLAISRRFPRILEIAFGNNIMRSLLVMATIIAGGLGWASGATARFLYDKYFPEFQLFSWLNKQSFSELTEYSAAGFNIIYFLLFATLSGVRGWYRNFGFSYERATVSSVDSYEQLLSEIESLTPEEIAYLLKDLHLIATKNNEPLQQVKKVVTTLPKSETSSLLIAEEHVAEPKEVPASVQKALGNKISWLVANQGIFTRQGRKDRPEKDALAPTAFVYNSTKSVQNIILDEDDDNVIDSTKPSKRCCIIL